MTLPQPAIRVAADPTNPGQFFACCGLLELADRLWEGAEGWFDDNARVFNLSPLTPCSAPPPPLLSALVNCRLANTMTDAQVSRRDVLNNKRKKEFTPEEEQEKKLLDKLWREAPLLLLAPFHLRLDWFTDSWTGGDRFKTWAGMQSVFEIARAMKEAVANGNLVNAPPDSWLTQTGGGGVPFNFDSNLGSQSSSLSVGFSLDPLRMTSHIRPLIELGALIGLQRFRPRSASSGNRHVYTAWTIPLLPAAAQLAVTGETGQSGWPAFEFSLLYRTQYLKSFLPANPV